MWDELAQPLPPRWVPLMGFLLPLAGGKFCVARMFDLWCRGKSGNDYLDVETFAVLTGVEVVRRHQRGAQDDQAQVKALQRRLQRSRTAVR